MANELKRAKNKFFSSLNPSNSKAFWKATKIRTKKGEQNTHVKSESGELISDDHGKAEMVNTFFSTSFNTCIPETDRDLFATSSSDCPSELLCTEDKMLEQLLSLDVTKANGPR